MKTKKELSRIRAKQVQQKYKKKAKDMRNSLAAKIRDAKGRNFSGNFYCDLCGNKHVMGYIYNIEGKEYEICKFCYNALFDKSPFTKIIYTPMGNNQ